MQREYVAVKESRGKGQLIFWVLPYDFQFNKSICSGKREGTWYPERWRRKQKSALSGSRMVFNCTAWCTHHVLSVPLASSAKCLLKARFWPIRDFRCLAHSCTMHIWLAMTRCYTPSSTPPVLTAPSLKRILDSISHDWSRDDLGTELEMSLLCPLLLLYGMCLRTKLPGYSTRAELYFVSPLKRTRRIWFHPPLS